MKRANKKRGLGGWLFLLLVVAAYGAVALFDIDTAGRAVGHFEKVMGQVLPVLVMVFILLLVIDLLLKPEWIKRQLGREAGIKGWVIAAFSGVLAAGPIYPWYALLHELRVKGMYAPLAAVFLYSRAIKLPLLPFMIHYFGLDYTIILCVYLLIFSFVSGLLMRPLEGHSMKSAPD
ncbi:MAG: permease [Thiohalophilus sp.]